MKTNSSAVIAARAWAKEHGLPDPFARYLQNAMSATLRGIGWELSFEEWWQLWQPHYHERGRGPHHKVLCRSGDVGPYAIGNVRIDYAVANKQDAREARRPRPRRRSRVMRLAVNMYSPDRPLRPDEALEIKELSLDIDNL